MLDKFLEDYNSAVSICMVDEEEGFKEIKKVVESFNNNNIIIPKDKFIYKEPLKESDAFIKIIPVKENCFITMSMRKHSKNGNGIDYELTFEYKKGNDCISFEPRHGAICIYRLLPVGHEGLEGTSLEDTNIDRWHYLLGNYNYSTWTQLGVESSGLKDACLENDHDRIFSILQEFYNYLQGE